MTLESLKSKPYSQVEYFWRQGCISDETWEAYCHLWQTSAPRFGLQACHCTECMKNPTNPWSD